MRSTPSAYASTRPARPPSAADPERLARIARRLRDQVVSQRFKLPMLPSAIDTLLGVAVDPNSSVKQLEGAIATEPMIAARVVMAANSALYNSRGSVRSLHQAALRLGCMTLRDLVTQAIAEAHVFNGRPRSVLARLRDHSIAVAHLTRFTCALTDGDEQYAFLCGLLHNIGHPILLDLLERDPPGERLHTHERQELCDLLHTLIGERVARAWGLPELVIEVCRYHHCYLGSDEDERSGILSGMNTMVAAADRLACHLGMGDRKRAGSIETDPIWEALALDEVRRTALLDHATMVVAALR
ncbi:MAG: HDOD domain-containing protein [Nannocystaceae bacterium]